MAHAQPGGLSPLAHWLRCGDPPGSLAPIWETPQPPLTHARHHTLATTTATATLAATLASPVITTLTVTFVHQPVEGGGGGRRKEVGQYPGVPVAPRTLDRVVGSQQGQSLW